MTTPLSPHDVPYEHEKETRESPARETARGALVAAVVAVAGPVVGVLWLLLAPRVPLVSDGTAVYLANSEGEEAIAADGTFTLLGLAAGALAASAVFLWHRRGGVASVLGLAAGSLLGVVLAWRVGVWLGPDQDLVAQAKAAGRGTVFEAPLALQAKAALLAWPVAAMLAHLGLTAVFVPEDPEPVSAPLPADRNEPGPGQRPSAAPEETWAAPRHDGAEPPRA